MSDKDTIKSWGLEDAGVLSDACKALWMETNCCFTLDDL